MVGAPQRRENSPAKVRFPQSGPPGKCFFKSVNYGSLVVWTTDKRCDLIHSRAVLEPLAMSDRRKPAVLIVEDDALVRLLAVDIAEEAGFIAVEAEDADEAVAILEARSDIAVLFTDINMPGSMDGLKLAHAVRHRWPPVKIIVVSGQVRLSPSDLPPDTRFFPKPYRASHMISELRNLLGGSEMHL
jgi:CheY-like chemotaxis protein